MVSSVEAGNDLPGDAKPWDNMQKVKQQLTAIKLSFLTSAS